MSVLKKRKGYDALWLWFGLGRAGFCVLPRVFMHEMPDRWQRDMAKLLREWDSHWNWDACDFDYSTVSLKKYSGRFVKVPEWLCNYRHPDCKRIASVRKARAK